MDSHPDWVPEGARLLRRLGSGSIFQVALVEHAGRRRILKRLKLRMLTESIGRGAIAREKALLTRVRHASVPRLVSDGEDDRGPYLIQEALEGAPLRRLVDEAERSPPRPRLVSALARAAFEALAELHALEAEGEALELVHGDIAPDHVWVERERVRFVDFGQARWRGMELVPDPSERGTMPYVPPEVARGEVPPDQSADVYALAASFAHVALGRRPCSAQGPAMMVEIAERGLDVEALERSERTDARLREALAAALRFDAARRLCRADEVLARLR